MSKEKNKFFNNLL